MEDILVLGGGLAGLSAAYHLKSRRVTVLEKETEPGGLCRSFNDGGYYFDYAPHILYPQDQYIARLIKRLLKGNLRIRKREAWIWHRKYRTYTRFPFQFHLYGLPDSLVAACLADMEKIRKRRHRKSPADYRQWLERRYGKAMCDEFLVPYSRKLWTVPPASMNCDWLPGRVADPDTEEVLSGAQKDTPGVHGFNPVFWYPEKGGIGALPAALAAEVPGTIKTSSDIRAIDPVRRTVRVKDGPQMPYRAAVSTLPLPILVRITAEVPEKVKKAADRLRFNRAVCVNLAVARAGITDKHWIYYHDRRYSFNRISLPSNFSPATVPGPQSSVCTEITCPANSRVRKTGLEERIYRQLIDTGLISERDRIVRKNVLNLPYAYVIYDRNRKKALETIHGWYRKHGILCAGRFGDWAYYNIDAAILSGKRAAEKIKKGLNVR